MLVINNSFDNDEHSTSSTTMLTNYSLLVSLAINNQ